MKFHLKCARSTSGEISYEMCRLPMTFHMTFHRKTALPSFHIYIRNRDPHRENVENILAICLPIMTMQHISRETCLCSFMWQIYFQSNLNIFSVGSSVQVLIQGIIVCQRIVISQPCYEDKCVECIPLYQQKPFHMCMLRHLTLLCSVESDQ